MTWKYYPRNPPYYLCSLLLVYNLFFSKEQCYSSRIIKYTSVCTKEVKNISQYMWYVLTWRIWLHGDWHLFTWDPSSRVLLLLMHTLNSIGLPSFSTVSSWCANLSCFLFVFQLRKNMEFPGWFNFMYMWNRFQDIHFKKDICKWIYSYGKM